MDINCTYSDQTNILHILLLKAQILWVEYIIAVFDNWTSCQELPLFTLLFGLYDSGKVSTKQTKMVGFIHPGWLAGVSRGSKSNQKKNYFQNKIQR